MGLLDYRIINQHEREHDPRGTACWREACRKTILYPVTMPGAGCFCSMTCAEAEAKRIGIWPKDRASA